MILGPAILLGCIIVNASYADDNNIATALEGLPIVNTIDMKGKHGFSIRGYEDFRYRKQAENAGSLESSGGPNETLIKFTTKDTANYTFYDINGLVLKDGETAAITLTIIGHRDYAGMAVGNNVFLLGRHANRGKHRDDGTNMNPFRTPDYMAYIAKVSKELGPETVVITRKSDTIYWFACGRKGSYTIEGLRKAPQLSLFAHGKCEMSRFRKGKLSKKHTALLQSCIQAPRHPYGRPNTPGFAGRRSTPGSRELAKMLSADLAKPLSDSESEAIVNYVAALNEPAFGSRVGPLFSLPGLQIPSQIFLITRRKDVLDNLIRVSDPALIARNGFEADGAKYGVCIDGEFNRYVNLYDYCDFPRDGFKSESDHDGAYFNEKHEYVCNNISKSGDAANARLVTPSLTAYCISLHPETWDKEIPDGDPCGLGKTYRQRAERYVKELALAYTDYKDIKLYNFLPEPVWDNYTEFYKDKKEFEARIAAWKEEELAAKQKGEKAHAEFLKANSRPQPKERRAGINRFSASVSCAGFAAQAAENLGDTESMKAIDACAEKFLKSWFNCFQFYAPGHEGAYLNEPDKWYRSWGYQPNCVNPLARDYDKSDYEPGKHRGIGHVRGEDIGHARITIKGMYMLYKSGRYKDIMTKKRITDLARTFNEIILPTHNTWRPLPRSSKVATVEQLKAKEGIDSPFWRYPVLMFADFNPELKAKLVKSLQEATCERTVLMNRLLLAEMRAKKHKQIPKKLQ